MKNILVPIGSSPNSHETLQYAVDFAAIYSSQVYAMEVFSASTGAGSLANVKEKVEQSSRQHLVEVIKKVDVKDVEVKIATYKGELVDGLKDIDQELGIDLIIISPRCNDVQEELYLGHTSGRIIKQTDIPTLIVPRGMTFSPFKSIMVAIRSGIFDNTAILNPLISIKDTFKSSLNLLFVKTPGHTEADLQINDSLNAISSGMITTEHANTYLGVLEQFLTQEPDLLCVFRRKRGFFKALWEKNTIPKSEFSAKIPVLVLSAKIAEI